MNLAIAGSLLSLLIELARLLLQPIRLCGRLSRFLFVLGDLISKDLFHCRGVGVGLPRARLLRHVAPTLRAFAVIRGEAAIAGRKVAK
jgi:hypothetical protein